MNKKLSIKELEKYLAEQANYYRSYYKEKYEDSQIVDSFGFDQLILGKAEAYEDCLKRIKIICSH